MSSPQPIGVKAEGSHSNSKSNSTTATYTETKSNEIEKKTSPIFDNVDVVQQRQQETQVQQPLSKAQPSVQSISLDSETKQSRLYRWRLYALFMLWGGMSLSPWMMFAVAHDYYIYKLGDNWANATLEEKYGKERVLNSLQRTYESVFVLSFAGASILGSMVGIYVSVVSTEFFRMVTGQSLCVFGVVGAIVLAVVNSDSWQIGFMMVSLVLPSIANFGGVCLCIGTVIGMASVNTNVAKHGLAFTSIGQAAIGTIYAMTSLMVKASTKDAHDAGIVFFSVGAAIVTASFVFYGFAVKFHWFQRAIAAKPSQDMVAGDAPPSTAGRGPSKAMLKHMFRVLNAIKFDGIMLILSYIITFSIYPGFSALVVTSAVDSPIWKEYFKEIATFLLHNVFNAIGRGVCLFVEWPKSSSRLWFIVLIPRLGIAYLLFLCHVNDQDRRHSTTWIKNDFVYVSLVAVHALGHGYDHCLLTMYAARRHHDHAMVGALTSWLSSVGLFSGAVVNIIIMHHLL